MRTPALACTILAVAALSPLATAAPLLGPQINEAKVLRPAHAQMTSVESIVPANAANTRRSIAALGHYDNTDVFNPARGRTTAGGSMIPPNAVKVPRSVPPVGHYDDTGIFDPTHVRTTTGGSMIPPSPGPVMLTRGIHALHIMKEIIKPRKYVISLFLPVVLSHFRRLNPRNLDRSTIGGNAYSGSTGDVSGGSVVKCVNSDMLLNCGN